MSDGTIKILTDLSTEGFEKGISKLGSLTKTGFAVVGTAITATSAALVGLGGYAVKVGSSFEAGMSEVGAISGATGKDLEALTAKAKEMGSTTKFSATESAEALKYMAMAGWDTDKMLSGLPGIMNLAAASGENLGLVSDIVTDSMTAFGLSADKAGRFADVLAQASNKSNTSVGLMGETFKYVAPVAGALGYSVEDTAVAIGLMANSGIKGSQAGTALRSTLSRLAKPTDEVQEAMDDLGISLTDSEGNMKAFKDVVGDMRTGFKGLTKEQQAQYAASIAGQEGMSGLLAIVNASDDDFNALTEAINNADGAAEAVAKTMQDNLQGSITIAKSALEGLGITVYEQIEAPLKSAVEAGTGYINELNEAFSHGLDSGVESLGGIFADIAVKAAESAPKMIESGKNVLLAFCDGIEKNSKEIAKSAIKIGKELIKAFAELIPQIGKIGLEIITEFAKELFGYGIGKKVDALGKTIETSFNKIVDSVKNAIDTLSPVISRLTKVFLDVANAGVKILADAISFLCDNINIVLPVIAAVAGGMIAWDIFRTISSSIAATSTAIAAFTAVTTAEGIATAVSTVTITAKQMAVGVLTGKIGLVTAAQWLWNAAMMAFGGPIGLIIVAVAALVAGLAALSLMQEQEITTEERLAEANSGLAEVYAKSLSGFGKYKEGVSNANGILDTLNRTVGVSAERQQELASEMETCQSRLNEIVKTASDGRRELTEGEIEELQNLIEKMHSIAEEQLKWQQSLSQATQDEAKAVAESNKLSTDEYINYAQNIAKTAQDTKDAVEKAASEKCTAEIQNWQQLVGTAPQYTQAWYEDQVNKSIAAKQATIDTTNAQMTETNAILSEGYAQRATSAQSWVDVSAEYNAKELELKQKYNADVSNVWADYNAMADKNTQEAKNALLEAQTDEYNIASKAKNDLANLREGKLKHLQNISSEEVGTLLEMVATSEGSYDQLNDATKSMVDQYLLDLATLPEPSRLEMNETLKGMNLEITEGGKLIHTNGANAGQELIKGWTDKNADIIKSVEGTMTLMDRKSGESEITAPKLLPISNAEETGYSARTKLSDIFSSPIYQDVIVTTSYISGNRDTSTWAKGGVTGYASGGVTKYANGGVAPKIAKHAAGVFTKRTRLWDPVTGINEYGEAGHEALLPLKTSVFDEIAQGIVRQLSPAKLSGMMSQLKAAVQSEAGAVSLQITAKSDVDSQYNSQTKAQEIFESMAQKMDAMLEKLERLANLTIMMDSEKVGKLVAAPVNAGLGDIYNMEERGKF